MVRARRSSAATKAWEGSGGVLQFSAYENSASIFWACTFRCGYACPFARLLAAKARLLLSGLRGHLHDEADQQGNLRLQFQRRDRTTYFDRVGGGIDRSFVRRRAPEREIFVCGERSRRFQRNEERSGQRVCDRPEKWSVEAPQSGVDARGRAVFRVSG